MRREIVVGLLAAGAVALASCGSTEEPTGAGGAGPVAGASDCGPVDFDHYDAGPEVEGLERTATERQCEDGGAPTRLNALLTVYGDCEAAPDAGCAPPASVQSWPACEHNLALYEKYPGPEGVPAIKYRRTTVRGVPAAIFDGGRRIEVYTGDATVVVFGETRRLTLAVTARLTGVHDGRAVSASEDLPAPLDGALEGELPC